MTASSTDIATVPGETPAAVRDAEAVVHGSLRLASGIIAALGFQRGYRCPLDTGCRADEAHDIGRSSGAEATYLLRRVQGARNCRRPPRARS